MVEYSDSVNRTNTQLESPDRAIVATRRQSSISVDSGDKQLAASIGAMPASSQSD